MSGGFCEGMGMRCCDTCVRNLDNNPGVHPERTIVPMADPPHCGGGRPFRCAPSMHRTGGCDGCIFWLHRRYRGLSFGRAVVVCQRRR